jgi:hypothetical protein
MQAGSLYFTQQFQPHLQHVFKDNSVGSGHLQNNKKMVYLYSAASNKKVRDLTLFNLTIDSKLRAYNLCKILIDAVSSGMSIVNRTMVVQQKTHRPVSFNITEQTRHSVTN